MSWSQVTGPALLILALSCLCGAQEQPPQPTAQGAHPPDLVLQVGHTSQIFGMAMSPDGRLLATASSDHTVKLWEVATGYELRTFSLKEQAMAVAFTRDGGRVIACGGEGIEYWDAASGEEVRHIPTGYLEALAVSPDGRWLVSGGADGIIRVWDLPAAREVRQLTGHKHIVRALVFSRDGRLLASGSGDETIKVWDFANGRVLADLAAHEMPTSSMSLAFSADGTLLAGNRKDSVILWRVATGKQVRKFSKATGPVAFSPDGYFLAATTLDEGRSVVRLWDLRAPAKWHDLPGGPGTIPNSAAAKLAFGPDGRELVAAGLEGGIWVWHDLDGGEASAFGRQSGLLIDAQFGGDGRSLFLAVVGSGVGVFEARTGTLLRTLPGPSLAMSLTQDGRHLAAPNMREGVVRLWDVETGQEEGVLDRQGYAQAAALSPDGRLLAAGGTGGTRGRVSLYETGSGRLLQRWEPNDMVHQLVFSPDGAWLAAVAGGASAGPSGTNPGDRIRLYPVNPPGSPREFIGHEGHVSAVAFSSDGRRLASGGYDKVARLWEVESGKLLRRFSGHTGQIWAVAISPDGRQLATAGTDQTIRLWEVSTGSASHVLRGHSYWITSVQFSPDGRWLLSASGDGSARVWDARTGDLAATIVLFANGRDWVVVTPDGLFDGTPSGWRNLLWRFNNNSFDRAPVEVFFREYYYPGLLADILAEKRPRAKTDIANLDRRQPEVKLALRGGQAAGTAVVERRAKVAVQVEEAPAGGQHAAGSGAQDVRLFRNGSLVHIWHGDVLAGQKQARLEAEVTLVAGENRLTAYAFNHDNIKSSDATLTVTGADSLKRPGTAYILVVGINQYASSDFNLRYAAADAQDFAQEIEREQKKLGRYGKVEVTSLQDSQATKANLLVALQHLAKVAQPEDAVFLYYAGHGTAAGPRFYLIPHDLGYAGGRDRLDEAAVQSVLGHSVSDLELDEAFETIDAGEIVLVIDACRSGQALQADDPRQGPMNSKGLAQLAYEKGMYILTASQGYQAALEASSYGHGLLTYALVEEGLKTAKADEQPQDGEITLREWLDFASREVPQLELALMQAAEKRGMELSIVEGEQKIEEVEKRSLQRPRVFYRREPEATPFVVARP